MDSGFIDLQVNGYLGMNFSDPGLTVGAVRSVTRELVARGTEAYCPTVVTTEDAVYEANLPVLAAAMDEPDLKAHLLGIHMEGPFLSEEGRGAHCVAWLKRPDTALFDRWQKLARGRIRILTLAPELDGSLALIRHAAQRGVLVSLGHHMASAPVIAEAVEAGARLCTHLGNGIPRRIDRHENPIWSQLVDDRLTAMFITDGHHLPPALIRTALRAKGLARFVVVSDVSAIAGLPVGRYSYMGGDVDIEPSGRISQSSGGGLAGSSATLRECAAYLDSLGVLTPAELRQVCRDNALRLLNG